MVHAPAKVLKEEKGDSRFLTEATVGEPNLVALDEASRSGEVSVARYLARHELFFAVGDAIGYFPDDLGAIGKPVPLDGAFDD